MCIRDRHRDWDQKLSEHERAVRSATSSVEDAEHNRKRTQAGIAAMQEEIDGIRRKVFDEVFGFIDERGAALGREKRKAEEDIRSAECAVEMCIRDRSCSRTTSPIWSVKGKVRPMPSRYFGTSWPLPAARTLRTTMCVKMPSSPT